MRIKPAVLLLTMLMILLSVTPVLAETCTLCGGEAAGSTYLCADCLTALLRKEESPSTIAITEMLPNADGSVTLIWEDSAANGPYTVYYELLDRAPTPFGWTAVRGTESTAVTLTQLVPGVSYVFTVADAAGNRTKANYYAPAAKDGNEIGAKIRIHTKLIKPNNDGKVLEYPWRVHEFTEENGWQHGLYVKLAYSMLRADRNYAFRLAVEAPNGFADVVYSGSLTLTYGKSEVPAWGFVEMDDYFSYLTRYYGGIPTGEYLVTLYFNGQQIYTTSFDVTE